MCEEESEKFQLIRNTLFKPCLHNEGVFTKNLPEPNDWEKKPSWCEDLRPSQRMFYHQTLSSARKFAEFHPNFNFTPNDSLDFALSAKYNHASSLFPEKLQYVSHCDVKCNAVKRLRNTTDLRLPKDENLGHPLIVGGLTERVSPHSVRLINSGHHSQLTNPGYSRQPADGNFFNY